MTNGVRWGASRGVLAYFASLTVKDKTMDKTQEQAQHTPLPWKQHTGNGKTYANVRGADDRWVADCGSRSDDIAQANAAFIVRACNCHDDLLAALQNALASLHILPMPQLDSSVATNADIIQVTIKGIRAAIAKATE